jgi:DNA-binding NarL/FixJ family response regulator
MQKPRVLLADDYVPLLKALSRLLEQDCDLVGYATTAAELFDLAATSAPDVVVLDLSLPDASGIDACRHLRSLQPAIRIVMLTAIDDHLIREAAMEAGASDFVLKRALDEQLMPAIRGVCPPEAASP